MSRIIFDAHFVVVAKRHTVNFSCNEPLRKIKDKVGTVKSS